MHMTGNKTKASNVTAAHIAAADPFSEDATQWKPEQVAELDAARKNLGAEVSELAPLLTCIHKKKASPQQAPDLLANAYARVKKLRETQSELPDMAGGDPELTTLINRAGNALHAGAEFSLDDAAQAYEKAYRRCAEIKASPDCAAALRAAQGRVAAAQQDYRTAAGLYAEAASTPGLNVPMQWQYQNERAAALAELGHAFHDNAALEQAIELYENKVLPLAPIAERPDDWAATQNNFGIALGILGQRHRGTWLLERAIAAFESALSKRPRDRAPQQWAATQNNLGNSLGILAQRHNDIEMLEKSLQAFERALEERTEERAAMDWATTQNNLGAVLQTLGQRKKDTKLLKRSVEAYKSVLRVWTRDRVPLHWAATFDNLGTALRLLGEHRKGPRTLEQSIAAYNNALAERTRERVPQEWAKTQNNLGAALQKLAERIDDPRLLEKSVAAYENALKEWTRERMPMAWAMTMANLGVAQRTLAEATKDASIAQSAVETLVTAVGAFRNASHAQYTELGEEQLAKARKLAAELNNPQS